MKIHFAFILFTQQAIASLQAPDFLIFQNTTWNANNNIIFTQDLCIQSSSASNEIKNYTAVLNNDFNFINNNTLETLATKIQYTDKISHKSNDFSSQLLISDNNSGSTECLFSNAQITLEISSEDLFAVSSGSYLFSSNIEFSNDIDHPISTIITASLSIPDIVSINQFSDINLGTWSGQQQLYKKIDNICIYDNTGGNYSVTISGNGGNQSSSEFSLTKDQDTPGNLFYSVKFNEKIQEQGKPEIHSHPNTQAPGCLAQYNANLSININQDQLVSVTAGIYTGTLIITVAPN